MSASPVVLLRFMNIPFVDFEFFGFAAALMIIASFDSTDAPARQVATSARLVARLTSSRDILLRDIYTRRVLVPPQGKFFPREMEA